ncbi:hypothetical protein ACJJTC_004603 [Scirpophaga incertulas]
MKLFVIFAALVAVAVGGVVKPSANPFAELEAIVAAINSPHTDPATAVLLEQQLHAIMTELNPISVGPAIVEQPGIVVGPAIVEQPDIVLGPTIVTAPQVVPMPEVVNPSPVINPSPVVNPSPIVQEPSPSSPLVQIILNINQPSDVGVSPVVAPATVSEIVPTAVNFVDNAESPFPSPVIVPVPEVIPSPVIVVEEPPTPVQIVNEPPTPVQVVDEAIAPSPAVTLPEILG